MNFTKDLLHQIHDPNLTSDERALARCRLAKRYEESGNYEAAREAMGDLWDKVGEQPRLEGLKQSTSAEVLLRVGTLTGWIGSTKQIEGAQETAKNLISQSIGIFESVGDLKKVAEAQTEIGYCYWREGAFDEARIVLKQALSELSNEDGDLKGVALLRSAAVEKDQNRLAEALHILTTAAPLFEASSNHSLKGRFHNEFATVLKNLGATEKRADYVDRALIEYEAASYHFGEARHTRYQACVENNLAMLFLRANRLTGAHEHLVRAQALFTRLGDYVHLAQVEETWARLFLAEGDPKQAEKFANSAVEMLERGGEQSLLAEALIVLGVVLSRLSDEDRARTAFQRAITIGEHAGDLEKAGLAALTLFEQLSDHLADDEIYHAVERAHELLSRSKNAETRNRLIKSIFHSLSLIHIFRPGWEGFTLEQRLQRHEARYIRLALEDAGGVVSKAARLLGVSRQILDYRFKNPHMYLRNVLPALVVEGEEAKVDDTTMDLDEAVSQKSRPANSKHEEDQTALKDAISAAEQRGDSEGAGLATLTLFERFGHQLSDDKICEILERARDLLRHSTSTDTRDRLLECSYRALSLIHVFRPNWDNFSLYQTLHRHQARYIRMALEDAGGVKSKAARLLGLPRHTNLHYMLKNPNLNVLGAITTTSRETDINEGSNEGAAKAISQRVKTIRVLHVEDNLTVATLVREIIESQTWEVELCVAGSAALAKLLSDADYDVLLVDYQLPGLDGLELIQHVRRMVHRRYMPIVMLSGTLIESAALEAGADAFLRKPQDLQLLVETIGRLLELREQRG
jgi:CheY-like chemotaxis protein